MALSRGLGAYDDGTAAVPGVGTNPLDVRKALSGLFSSAGVVAGGPSPLVTGTAGFAYSVAGPVQFVTSRGASDGHQLFANDGPLSIACPAAPGSGLSRIDIIWVRHPTNTENGDTSSQPILGVSSGTAASSNPAVPSIPTGALELARNTMTSAATSTLTSPGNVIAQTAQVASLRGAEPMPHIVLKASAPVSRNPGWSQATNLNVISESSGVSVFTHDGTGIVTLLKPGVYSFDSTISMTASTFAIRINKGSKALTQSTVGSGTSLSMPAFTKRACVAGDTIYVTVNPATTASISAETDALPSFLSITRDSD